MLLVPSIGGIEKVIGALASSVNEWRPEGPENNGAGGPVWSPDGSYLLVAGAIEKNSAIHILKLYLNGKRESSLTSPPPAAIDTTPRISPSGDSIAFTRNWGANSFDLYVVPSYGGLSARLTFDSRDIQGLAWLDNQNLIYSSNRAGNFHLWQIARSGGDSRSVSAGGAQPQWPAISRDGHWLAFVEQARDASIWHLSLTGDRSAAPAESFISSAGQDSSPAYSPDEKKIAFVSDRSGSLQIWISDSDGLGITQLTTFKGSSLGSPGWSPDSRRIVFDATKNAQSAVWLIDADGSNLHRLNSSTSFEYLPTWSRDGQWIYFCSLRGGRTGLWKQSPDSGQEIHLTEDTFFDAVESSDGRIVYVQQPHGGTWQFPATGGKPVPVPELARIYSGRYWTLKGSLIYFVRQKDCLMN